MNDRVILTYAHYVLISIILCIESTLRYRFNDNNVNSDLYHFCNNKAGNIEKIVNLQSAGLREGKAKMSGLECQTSMIENSDKEKNLTNI